MDGRGSKDQRTLYEYLRVLYPRLEIAYEFPLYDLNQRIDLFVPALGLAIEYNGLQHYQFVNHFHKDFEDYKKGRDYDQRKLEYLTSKGVKLVVISHKDMVNSPEELKERIDSVEYPAIEYSGLDSFNPIKKERLERDREYRKKQYRKYKEKK